MFEWFINFFDLWTKLKCQNCSTIFRTKDVEFIHGHDCDICYDPETFECPNCKSEVTL